MGNYDIIGITETWARNDIADAEYEIAGYNLFRKDRQGKDGGGVAIYVRDSLGAALYPDLMSKKFEEALWCTVKCDKTSILVGVVYRTPSSM